MLVCLMLSQRSLRLSSFLFILFSLFYSTAVNSTILSSRSLICSYASVILLLIPSSVFFTSVIVLFISVCLFFNSSRCLFFNSSRSLLNISCIFLIFSNLFIYFYLWLSWVFVAVHGLSLVVASGGYSSLQCTGFSFWWLLFLRSMGYRRADSVVVAHGL